MNMTRTVAGKLLEKISIALTAGKDDASKLASIAGLLSKANIPVAERCTGEAHSNPHINNCGQCTPRWGWIQEAVKVR